MLVALAIGPTLKSKQRARAYHANHLNDGSRRSSAYCNAGELFLFLLRFLTTGKSN